MAHDQNNEALNGLLINLSRSLLQYIGEGRVWTDVRADGERQELQTLVGLQSAGIAELANLLAGREWDIDFGTFPTDYTDLHDISLDFLFGQLIEQQQGLDREVASTVEACSGDSAAADLLSRLTKTEQEITERLQKLAGSRRTAAAS